MIRGSWASRLCAACLSGALVWLLAAPAAVASQVDVTGKPFSAGEKARLRAGELVTRPAREKRGPLELVGGAAWQVIDRPLEAVWAGLMDTSRYHRWLPQVSRALESPTSGGQDDQRLIRIEHKTGPFDVHYYLRANVDREKRDVTFRLAKTSGGKLNAAWGFFSVRPYGADRCLFSFGVMADIGDGLFAGMLRGTAQEWMLKVPWMMKRFMEGSGRWIYKPK